MGKSLLTTAELARRYATGSPVALIAQDAGISRIAVWQRLKAAGVPMTRRQPPALVTCAQCGRPFMKHRHAVMRVMRSYCSRRCYVARVVDQGKAYYQSRQGQRVARRTVRAYVPLAPGHVVHHHDQDTSHNEVRNLAVFASHREHMSFHRGGKGRPIWDGAKLPLD